MTPDELLEAWCAGDRPSGDAFIRMMFEPVRRFIASHCGNEVEELTQETFSRVTSAKSRYTGQGTARAFLFGVARNVVREHYRRKGKATEDFEEASVRDLGAGPSTLRWRKQSDALLLESLRTLPLDMQMAVLLHYWEGFKKREIAEILDIPQGTVASRIQRARERMRAYLQTGSAAAGTSEGPIEMRLDDWARRVRESSTLRE